jgi:hypothetical protein
MNYEPLILKVCPNIVDQPSIYIIRCPHWLDNIEIELVGRRPVDIFFLVLRSCILNRISKHFFIFIIIIFFFLVSF